MPDIRNKSTVKALAKEFVTNGRHETKTMKTIGYADTTAEHRAHKVLRSVVVKKEIARLDAKQADKLEHNRQIAIDSLNTSLVALEKLVKKGNVSAISAKTAVIRELDAISNLHSSTVYSEDKDTPTVTDAEAARIRLLTKNLALMKQG